MPVSWTGSGLAHLTPIDRDRYAALMGDDDGLLAAVYAAALAFRVRRKIPMGTTLASQGAVSACVAEQDRGHRFLTNAGPKEIDLGTLAERLSNANEKDMPEALVLSGLRALSFNLVFRRLKLAGRKIGEDENDAAFRPR